MTENDVTSLEGLARARAATARERHVLLAADLYAAPRGLVTDAERSLLTGMIEGLVARIAARLDITDAGAVEPAIEALRRARVFADPELVGAAYHRLLEFEIERRAPASDVVTALAEGQDMEVVAAVTAYRVWRAARLDAYGDPTLDEDDLPPEAVARLYWSVAAVRGRADPTREDVIEAATLGELAALDETRETPPVAAARHLLASGLVSPAMLPSFIETGEIALAEAVLARLADIPIRLARGILFEPGGETLAIAACAAGLDRAALVALIAVGRGARPRGGDCAEALALVDHLQAETAVAVLRRLKRHPAYQDAVRRLEGAGAA